MALSCTCFAIYVILIFINILVLNKNYYTHYADEKYKGEKFSEVGICTGRLFLKSKGEVLNNRSVIKPCSLSIMPC